MNTRTSDELLLIAFAEDQGFDHNDLMAAVSRLRLCIEKELEDYCLGDGLDKL